jgi:hypothetical protein
MKQTKSSQTSGNRQAQASDNTNANANEVYKKHNNYFHQKNQAEQRQPYPQTQTSYQQGNYYQNQPAPHPHGQNQQQYYQQQYYRVQGQNPYWPNQDYNHYYGLSAEDQEKLKKRHNESKEKYPDLNLSQKEFVITYIKRHPFGLWSIWLSSSVIIFITIAVLIMLIINQSLLTQILGSSLTSVYLVLGAVTVFMITISIVGSLLAAYIYKRNEFILTNESVIQHIQKGLFSRHEQTISLKHVEDASYQKTGLVQYIFNFGSIRLSTIGDESTYRFTFVENPKKQVAFLNNAIEKFKRGQSLLNLKNSL